MPIYQPSKLHQFLKQHTIRPNRKLSQNFLIDGNILKKILNSSNLNPGDVVIEIGAGPGALTEGLLSYGVEVIAIEKDPSLATHLKRLDNKRLEVIADDFRNIHLDSLLQKRGPNKVKIVANIPYHLTGLILKELLPKNGQIESIHLMVQKEVAERCTALVGTTQYSALTLFVNYHALASCLFSILNTSFYPKPKIDSAMVQFKLHNPPVGVSSQPLFRMIRTAFQKRRKMLRSSLKKELVPASRIETALEQMGLSKESRPQELTLAHFATLFTLLYPKDEPS